MSREKFTNPEQKLLISTAVTMDNLFTQIDAINKKHFQMLHSLAELTIIKDETVSLEEKQNQLTDIAKSVGSNCENIAFYDAQGNAVIGDGRTMNFATRPYFNLDCFCSCSL